MRFALAIMLFAGLGAAELPPVPDPYGLGERLALIDHLQDAYGVRPPAGASLADLQQLYVSSWQARQPVGDPGQSERVARLCARILARHDVQAGPELDEEALKALLARLDAERAEADRRTIAERVAADQAAPRSAASDPAAEPVRPAMTGQAVVMTQPPATAAAPAKQGEVRRIPFSASGVTDCWLAVSGERTALLVTFGLDHNGAFTGVREGVWTILRQSPSVSRSVLLLGHGRKAEIAGESISGHLEKNKQFYETMGGTAPAQPVACLILAACANGIGPSQMPQMRDGLGYYPIWRVATGEGDSANILTVLAALDDVVKRPAAPAYRARYRIREGGEEVTSFGEVGEGTRGAATYWRIVQDEVKGWRIEEQR